MIKTRVVRMILNLYQSEPVFSKRAAQRGRVFQKEIAAWIKKKGQEYPLVL